LLEKEMQECFNELSMENQRYILNLARRIYEIEQKNIRINTDEQYLYNRNRKGVEWER